MTPVELQHAKKLFIFHLSTHRVYRTPTVLWWEGGGAGTSKVNFFKIIPIFILWLTLILILSIQAFISKISSNSLLKQIIFKWMEMYSGKIGK